MAINWSSLNFGFGKGRADTTPESHSLGSHTITEMIGEAVKAPLPVVGHKSFRVQMQILGGTLALLVVFIAGVVVLSMRNASYGTAYVSAAGQMRTLSQQISNEVQQGLQGHSEAFKGLDDSRKEFDSLLATLKSGGKVGEASVPAAPEAVHAQLQKVSELWATSQKNTGLMMAQQKNLVALGAAVRLINDNNATLLDLAEQVAAAKLQGGAGAREIAESSRLVMLTQRMAKNANALLAADLIDPEVTFLLGKDSNVFRDVIEGLKNGSEPLRLPPTRDQETMDRIHDLEKQFGEYRNSVGSIMGSLLTLVEAKKAGRQVVLDSDNMLLATEDLEAALKSQAGGAVYTLLIGIAAIMSILLVVLMIKAYRDDNERRTGVQVRLREEAEKLKEEAEFQNKANQEAILRLMNEMGSLADGDLTVQATVSEDITGAIADSVNYTIEELRVLVGRINSTAAQVTSATESAAQTSARLLQAAERQSKEIQQAGASVLEMARQINDVSANAAESVNVARQSLNAAEKGQQAVQNSIAGMNDIRDQIQETAKRIKRLGESSQEIGEIV